MTIWATALFIGGILGIIASVVAFVLFVLAIESWMKGWD